MTLKTLAILLALSAVASARDHYHVRTPFDPANSETWILDQLPDPPPPKQTEQTDQPVERNRNNLVYAKSQEARDNIAKLQGEASEKWAQVDKDARKHTDLETQIKAGMRPTTKEQQAIFVKLMKKREVDRAKLKKQMIQDMKQQKLDEKKAKNIEAELKLK